MTGTQRVPSARPRELGKTKGKTLHPIAGLDPKEPVDTLVDERK